MKPLKANRQVLTWLCGVPPEECASQRQRIAHVVFTSIVIIGNFLAMIAGATFVYRNVTINLDDTFYGLINTFGSANMLYQSIVTVLLYRQLAEIFDGLASIYNESKG